MRVKTFSGKILTLKKELGSGGEGKVYEIDGYPSICVKIYNERKRKEKEKKVNELINVFIKVQKSGNKKAKIIFENYLAIPRGEIYDINTGEFLGFAMKKFDMSRLKPISYFFDNNINQNDKFDKSFKGRYKIAKNLIETVEVLHSFGIIVGDLNDKNVFVTEKNHIGILD